MANWPTGVLKNMSKRLNCLLGLTKMILKVLSSQMKGNVSVKLFFQSQKPIDIIHFYIK